MTPAVSLSVLVQLVAAERLATADVVVGAKCQLLERRAGSVVVVPQQGPCLARERAEVKPAPARSCQQPALRLLLGLTLSMKAAAPIGKLAEVFCKGLAGGHKVQSKRQWVTLQS